MNTEMQLFSVSGKRKPQYEHETADPAKRKLEKAIESQPGIDLIHQHYYRTEEELYTAAEEFAYLQYNHVRPHSYNNYKTPYEVRYEG